MWRGSFHLLAELYRFREYSVQEEPLATVRTTVVEVYDTEKCSDELIAIVGFEKLPAILLAARTVKVSPRVGMNAPMIGAASVPARLATPETCSWLYCVTTSAPPIGALNVPVEGCVYVPLIWNKPALPASPMLRVAATPLPRETLPVINPVPSNVPPLMIAVPLRTPSSVILPPF